MAKKSAAGGTISHLVDPRLELLSAVELAAGGNPCSAGENSAYAERLRSWLDPSHPAVSLFKSMSAADWRHRHPSLILLDFGPPPALEIRAHREHYLNAGADDAVARFLAALRRLADESRIAERFAAETDFYDKCLESLGAGPEPVRIAQAQEYWGLSAPLSYRFLVAPLYHGAVNHNVLYRRDDATFEIYSVLGHERVKAGKPEFGVSPQRLDMTVWHEVSHTVVDGVTKTFSAELESSAALYGLMTGLAKRKYVGPAGWPHMVDEHLIRAATARLAGRYHGAREGRRALQIEKDDGFALIGPVYELLAEYEADRKRYPTLARFYPRVLELLRRLGAAARPAAKSAR